MLVYGSVLRYNRARMQDNTVRIPNFLLVSIVPQKMLDESVVSEMKELKELVDAFGGKVQEFVVQRREVHDKGPYIGHGKIKEVATLIQELAIDVVVLNTLAKPSHLYEIFEKLQKTKPAIKVWDRADLILEIFDRHAHTAEAKLQIELASMRHMGPRIYGMGFVMSRQGGGIGTLGVGETNTELMKRHWRGQIKKIKDKIQKHSSDRERQLEQRIRNGIKTVSIVGYTNAGKTSLFNTLTGKKNTVQNALFVTLDSSVGKIFLKKQNKEVLLSDTIGFIRNLPTTLIDAFKSTLLESMYADLLLVVIDATDAELHKKIKVVEKILWELGITQKPRMYVFNKTDKGVGFDTGALSHIYRDHSPHFVSVKTGDGLQELLFDIEYALFAQDDLPAPKRKVVHAE